ncbi:toxin-antitoxin system YwqK family antitoxin [Fusobacterium sp. PH5-44]|uniref:toxin-antitoxin system YwqK family antitoxin n=1 Tax=unclassified Fusobacterium TaxID=2648384 RepID=UPI003D21268B
MKKEIIFFILLISAFLYGKSENLENIFWNDYMELYYKRDDESPFTGEAHITLKDSGNTLKYQFENGRSTQIEEYDKKNMLLRKYKINGNITYGVHYHEKTGNKIEEFYLDKEVLSGEFKRYFSNKKIAEEGMYKDGLLHGNRKKYFKNGKLNIDETYINGYLSGHRKEYDEKGILYKEEIYKNGKLNGVSKEFYSNQSLKSECNYVNGRGKLLEYSQNGTILSEKNIIDGNKITSMKTYYPNGTMSSEIKFSANNYTEKNYDENGKIINNK